MDTVNATITELSALTVSCSVITDITCNGGSNGTIIGAPSGAIPSISYQWKDGAGNSVGNNSALLSGVSADTYSVLVTDGLGCVDSCSIQLVEPNVNTTLIDSNTCNPTLAGIDTFDLKYSWWM